MGDEELVAEALAWLRGAAAKREEGVQHDKRHHERSACQFDVERARTHATISGLRLHHAQALIARIAQLEAELAGARETLGRIFEAKEDGDMDALFDVIEEAQSEMVLAALHANGFTLKGPSDD